MSKTLRAFSAIMLFCVAGVGNLSAQSTWDQVYNILSTKCYGSGCHQSGSNPSFDVTASKTDLYNQLVNGTPVNPYASGEGYSLIEPGVPERSLLLRKVAHSLGSYLRTDLTITSDEGTDMPPPTSGRPELTKVEVEIIRQWILGGADQNTAYYTADSMLLANYYTSGQPQIQQPAPPPEGEGFQVHFGPVFFAPNNEHEYTLKMPLKNAAAIEATGLDAYMSDESHHFILRKIAASAASGVDDGLIEVGLSGVLDLFGSDRDYLMTWQNDETFMLPNGTAYFWAPNTTLDLNFHMLNPHSNVVVGEVFLNIYTQPVGTADKEMKSGLEPNLALFIPNNGQPSTFNATKGYNDISIWTLTSHAHQWSTAFNLYLKGTNGASDSLIYDGNINYATGINQGYYDYEHPPTRFWEPFLESLYDTLPNGQRKYSGIRQEATYVNNTSSPITFGLTTTDEMMLFYIQYIDGKYKIEEDSNNTTGIVPIDINDQADVYPNPSQGNVTIDVELSENTVLDVKVLDLLGKEVTQVVTSEELESGHYMYQLNKADFDGAGVYFVQINMNGKVFTRKLVITE